MLLGRVDLAKEDMLPGKNVWEMLEKMLSPNVLVGEDMMMEEDVMVGKDGYREVAGGTQVAWCVGSKVRKVLCLPYS